MTPAQALVDYLNTHLPAHIRARVFAPEDAHLVVLVDTSGDWQRLPMFDEPVPAVIGVHAAPRRTTCADM